MAVDTNALLTLDEAKEFLEVEGNDEDAEIESLVDAVTFTVEDYTGRKLKSRDYTSELFSGTGTQWLRLREYPVTAVASVDTLSGVGSSGVTWQSESIKNLVILDTVEADRSRGKLFWRDSAFPLGTVNVRITYTAGFTTLPEQLKRGVRSLLGWYRRQQDRHAVGIGSRSFSGQSEVIGVLAIMNMRMPADIRLMLDPFKRWAA